jgi:acyl-CoA thioester hydrolase
VNAFSTVEITVRYAETDQMGVAYHANYLVWCDVARTHYLRERGASYRELEARGLRLAVVDAQVRYRSAARYDDRVQIRCWVRDVSSRGVEFGYLMEHTEEARPVATARTTLVALDEDYAITRIPADVRSILTKVADPVRL